MLVSERPIKQCPPSVLPGDRFLEIRFRVPVSRQKPGEKYPTASVIDPFHPLNPINF